MSASESDSLASGTANLALVRPLENRRSANGYRVLTGWTFLLVIVINAAVIVWLWLQGGGVSAVHSEGDMFTSIGRITGLLGAYLALVQVLLLARLPWLERLAGFDRLTVWHRRNGKICLYLVLAHVVFITLGYALSDKFSVPHEATTLLASYPGMVAATFGTALMVLVVVCSLVIVRSRLRYEAWYFVHLLVYLSIALAWSHQIPTGNEFTANLVAANYWKSLYLVTLALVLIFRFAQPIGHALRFRMRVAEVVIESPTVTSIVITGRHLEHLNVEAGQFFLWRFLSRGRWWEAHPFSISSPPDGSCLRITVKSVGDFSSRLTALKPGTRVVTEGPFGMFTRVAQRSDHLLLIAGGIGITPIRALLEELSGDLVLIYRVLRDEDIVFRQELARLVRERGLRLFYVVGDHATQEGRYLLSPEHLFQLVPDIETREIYLSGPPAMVRLIESNVRRARVPRKYIHTERFAL